MDAEVATQIYPVYIGKATKNLNSRLGGRIDSYLAHKEGNPHSDSKTMMCPAEKCAIEDGELITVSYATIPVGSYPKDWEAELIHQYVLQHQALQANFLCLVCTDLSLRSFVLQHLALQSLILEYVYPLVVLLSY